MICGLYAAFIFNFNTFSLVAAEFLKFIQPKWFQISSRKAYAKLSEKRMKKLPAVIIDCMYSPRKSHEKYWIKVSVLIQLGRFL